MNWFKKSIAYDQRRKLILLPLLIILSIILSIMGTVSIIKVDEMLPRYNGFAIGIGNISYVIVLGVSALIAIVSNGIRDKSEVSYMESMPMKTQDVTMTKLSCACIAAIAPLIVGFLLSTVTYIVNKGFLQGVGYLYLNIVYKYALMCLIVLIIIGLVYLASVLYKNIKVPIVLGIGGLFGLGYILLAFAECLSYSNPIKMIIGSILNGSVKVFMLVGNNVAVFYPITLAIMIMLLGVVVLLFVLINYVTSSANNDVYDKLFSFKASKVIYYILSVLIIMFIFGFALETLIGYVYISPLESSTNYQDALASKILNEKILFARRVNFVVVALLLPLWIFISKKIGKVLEERF